VPIGTPQVIESIELVAAGGGLFEVEADGELLFSRKDLGRHCEPAEIEEAIRRGPLTRRP
jgi:predicted Rdx family selenoprotein